MRHVRLDQVASRERRAQRQLTSQHSGGDDAGEKASVLAGSDGVGATHTKYVKHGGLRLENGATAQGADFDGRHRNGDLKRATETINC